MLFFKADGAATTDITIDTSGSTPNLIQGSAIGDGIQVFIDGDPGTSILADGNARLLVSNTEITNTFGAGLSLLVQDMATATGRLDATLDDVSLPQPARTDGVIAGSLEAVVGGGGRTPERKRQSGFGWRWQGIHWQ